MSMNKIIGNMSSMIYITCMEMGNNSDNTLSSHFFGNKNIHCFVDRKENLYASTAVVA